MRGRPSAEKLRKERARQDRKREKAYRRAQRRAQRDGVSQQLDGEDPDIAGIVPGPQPRLEQEVQGAETPSRASSGSRSETEPANSPSQVPESALSRRP
jgi:hypothetical protein